MTEDPTRVYIEEAGLLFEELGLSRMTGRVVACLLTCDPPALSSEALAEALGVSRGSVSTSTRTLLRMGFIRRSPQPGSRALYFRLDEDAWRQAMRRRMVNVQRLRELAERGLEAVAPASPSQRARLEGMRDFYAFFEARMPALIEEWLATQSSLHAAPEGEASEALERAEDSPTQARPPD